MTTKSYITTFLKDFFIPYLPVYKLIPCISRSPILEPQNVLLISGLEVS